ncbi:MAG: divalent metal cation transporter [Wenzhouxiangellaceae bacterium]
MPRNFSTLKAAIGPGLLMAGAAVGVSHLVQSTRAGAEYGLAMLGFIVLGLLAKYPFLEFGPRYASATGEHLIAGYRRLGRWASALFLVITVATMFTVLATVTLVTAGLVGSVFGLGWSISQLAAVTLTACVAVLAIGHYRGLDLLMKIIMAVLAVATLAAVVLAWRAVPHTASLWPNLGDPALRTGATLAFVLALLGWMPIPLDAAAWHSLWTLERARDTGIRPSPRHATIDFAIGYIGAGVLALAFLALGALMIYGTGKLLPGSAVAFATMLIDLYPQSLGAWARPVIATAALATMLSTTLTVADAYPRVLCAYLNRHDRRPEDKRPGQPVYLAALLIVAIGAWLVIDRFGDLFTTLIDFTTTVSFLSAPVIGWLNLRLMSLPHLPPEARLGRAMKLWSVAGLVFLTLFSLVWLAWRVIG